MTGLLKSLRNSSFFLMLYHLLGFPLFLFLFSLRKKTAPPLDVKNYYPSVALLIAAKNEENVIEKKIVNSLESDYPTEKLRILIVANGCTDRTVEIAEKYADQGVEVFEYGNIGKVEAQNRAVEQIDSDIIVFSDANAMFEPDAIRELVKPFSNRKIGVVEGKHCITRPETLVADTEHTYWKLIENNLKRAETQLGGTIGTSGSIYAVRRDLYYPVHPGCTSDFVVPLEITTRGYKTVFVDAARSYESFDASPTDEFHRKRRVVRHGVASLLLYPEFLNPVLNPRLSFLLFSHKILRWSIPLFSSIILMVGIIRVLSGKSDRIDKMTVAGGIGFGFSALVGCGIGQDRKVPFFSMAYFAFLLLKAVSLGVYDALTRGGLESWETQR